jgi:hypothetical protein
MTERLSDKIDKLAADVQERNESLVALQLQIDRRIDDLHARIDAKLDSGIEKHHQHITSLYANFRQIVLAGLAFLGAGATFLGYQSLSAIPDKFNELIKSNTAATKAELDQELKRIKDDLGKKGEALNAQADLVKQQQDKLQKAVSDINGLADKSTIDVTSTTQTFQNNAARQDAEIRQGKESLKIVCSSSLMS